MNLYKITMKHDDGKQTFSLYASTKKKAKLAILDMEKAPARAILKIEANKNQMRKGESI